MLLAVREPLDLVDLEFDDVYRIEILAQRHLVGGLVHLAADQGVAGLRFLGDAWPRGSASVDGVWAAAANAKAAAVSAMPDAGMFRRLYTSLSSRRSHW